MFEIDSDEITRPGNRPLCLAIGCSEELALLWAISVNAAGFVMRSVSLASSREVVRGRRPMVILVTNEVYAFDPAAILRMAEEGGAVLMLMRAAPVDGPAAITPAEEARLRSALESLRRPLLARSGVHRSADRTAKGAANLASERPTLRSPPPPARSGLRMPAPETGSAPDTLDAPHHRCA